HVIPRWLDDLPSPGDWYERLRLPIATKSDGAVPGAVRPRLNHFELTMIVTSLRSACDRSGDSLELRDRRDPLLAGHGDRRAARPRRDRRCTATPDRTVRELANSDVTGLPEVGFVEFTKAAASASGAVPFARVI